MLKFYPKKNQVYYMINSRWEVKETLHTGSKKSKARISAGNCFKTKTQANYFLDWMRMNKPHTRLEYLKAALLGRF